MRKAEIMHARWEWFEFGDQPRIRITASHGFDIKDYEERCVPMADAIKEALKPYAEEEGYLFESNQPINGKHLYRYDNKKSLLNALDKCGLEKKEPFQRLRRTFISLHVQAGTPKDLVQLWAGHAPRSVTDRFYVSEAPYDERINAF